MDTPTYQVPFIAIRDNILVLMDTPPQQTSSGIVIPTVARDTPIFGTIVSAGADVSNTDKDGIALFVQDRVYLPPTKGAEFDRDGKTYVWCKKRDILAMVLDE